MTGAVHIGVFAFCALAAVSGVVLVTSGWIRARPLQRGEPSIDRATHPGPDSVPAPTRPFNLDDDERAFLDVAKLPKPEPAR